MILAEQMVAAAALLLAHPVAGVQAGVAQRMDAVGRLAHQHHRAAADIGPEIIAVGAEAAHMVDRQPGTGEQVRDFGGEYRIGLEQLGGGGHRAARLDLFADRLDAVGKFHIRIQFAASVLLPL